MTFVVTQACVDIQDKSCIQVCPADCIYEGGRMVYINPDQCIDCGACQEVCPTAAIAFDMELTPENEKFLEINERFFDAVESARGGRRLGKIDHDVDVIAALPRKAG
ncbi:ferredoxin [Streptomyces sp. NPDC002896]|uniref:ferredoxin n=1 Tax=Streptomyces sp. NPDC002896 TaxID=3154438 RepID=UPI0033269123